MTNIKTINPTDVNTIDEYGNLIDENHIDNLPIERYTCYKCNHKDSCEYAFDWYNIDGDCLQMK